MFKSNVKGNVKKYKKGTRNRCVKKYLIFLSKNDFFGQQIFFMQK